jgi:hypothetical protein
MDHRTIDNRAEEVPPPTADAQHLSEASFSLFGGGALDVAERRQLIDCDHPTDPGNT